MFGNRAGNGWRIAAAAVVCCVAASAPAASNLVVNGSFDDPSQPLKGWKTKYDLPGESWYEKNHECVSVVGTESGRAKVMRMQVSDQIAGWQGIRADSDAIPIEKGASYKFSAWARSTGPDCRIMIEGFRWKPGIKPHANPDYSELRKCYKFEQLFFGPQKAGDFGGVGHAWSHADMTLPKPKMTKMAQELYDQVRFLVVHLVGIGGKGGELFVDDVVIEKVK